MASRAEQKAAARAAREQAASQAKAQQRRRSQMTMFGAVVAIAIVAVVVVIVASSSGGGKVNDVITAPQKDGAQYSPAAAVKSAKALLAGIPQAGNVLGNPSAPITITEYGDLACPTCDAFALTSEPQLISSEVRTGKVQLQFRAFETASSHANNSEYVPSQVAARAAGLQGKEWDYVVLVYDEQPQTIDGQPAEEVSYVSPQYLLSRAKQVPGLNIREWQKDLGSAKLAQDVAGDAAAGNALGVSGTPSIFVSGPGGTVQYDKTNTLSAVPSLQQLQALIKQVS